MAFGITKTVPQKAGVETVDSMYDEIEANKPGFYAEHPSAPLLISSPGALVHYLTTLCPRAGGEFSLDFELGELGVVVGIGDRAGA